MAMVEPFLEEVDGATVGRAVGESLGGIVGSLVVLIT